MPQLGGAPFHVESRLSAPVNHQSALQRSDGTSRSIRRTEVKPTELRRAARRKSRRATWRRSRTFE